MSISEQIAALEEELESFKNGDAYIELENRIQELEDANGALKHELQDLEDKLDLVDDIKSYIKQIDQYI